jgi:hypothetical protein
MLALCCSGCAPTLVAEQSNKYKAVIGGYCNSDDEPKARDIATTHCSLFKEQPIYKANIERQLHGCVYTYRCATAEQIEAEDEATRASWSAAYEKAKQQDAERARQLAEEVGRKGRG